MNKNLEEQIRIARTALIIATEAEETSGYDYEYTLERKYNEGFLEALEFIYTVSNGHEYI